MHVIEFLQSKIDVDQIISIFCNPNDPDSAAVGFIAGIDEEAVLINSVSTDGKYDGYEYRLLEYVTRVDAGTFYERNLEKLYDYRNQSHQSFAESQVLLLELLEYARDNDLVVGFGVEDPTELSVTGFVEEVDEAGESVTVRWLDAEGRPDGYTLLPFFAIRRMHCDGEVQSRRKILYDLLDS